MLSIVTTVYKSEAYLPQFMEECLKVLKELECPQYEMIFVLDGITDASKDWLLAQQRLTPEIKVVELSRNFGHHAAISAGLAQSTGDLVFLIDCDLEVSPSVLIDFMALWESCQVDVVFGVQQQRKGGFLEKHMGSLFWKLFNYLSDTQVPPSMVTERLMTREYVQALLSMGDKNLFLAGMMHWIGFDQVSCTVVKGQRKGESTYTFRKRVDLLVEALLAFSDKPLKWILYGGLGCILLSIAFLFGLLLGAFTHTLYAFLIFALGAVLSALGMIGMYLSRISNQVKSRPLYWVKKVYQLPDSHQPKSI